MQLSLSPITLNKMQQNYFENNISSRQDQSKNTIKNNDKLNTKLYWALGGLAVIAIAGVMYAKNHKITPISNNTISNTLAPTNEKIYSIQESIKTFLESIKPNKRDDITQKLQEINFSKYNLLNWVKNAEETFLPFKYFIASRKVQIDKSIELPSILSFSSVSQSKSKEVTKIFATMLDGKFASTKYTKGYLKEFVDSLAEFSSTSANRFKEDKTHTFLHFENVSEFLAELKQQGNEEHKLKFDNLIKNNAKNNITYVLDSESSKQLNFVPMLFLDFNEKINTLNLSKDLDECEYQLGIKLTQKTKNIDEDLSQLIYPNQHSFFMLRNLLLDTPRENVFIFDGQDKNTFEKAISLITSKTNSISEKINCLIPLPDLLSILIKKGEQAEELYSRTGKRTFLHLEGLEQKLISSSDKDSYEYTKLKDFIADAKERYHTLIILNADRPDNNLTKVLGSNDKTFYCKLFTDWEKAFFDSKMLMQERMKKNDFSHIDLDRFTREFLDFIAAERACKPGYMEKIKNGILLYGSEGATKITAEAIKNTVDANYIKIEFDKNNPAEIIDEMMRQAENAEKIFSRTGKRTIIELNKIDELLTNWKNNVQNSILIGEFKTIEDFSRKYHTTVLMRTSKPLKDFEAASIASNRMGLRIEVK